MSIMAEKVGSGNKNLADNIFCPHTRNSENSGSGVRL